MSNKRAATQSVGELFALGKNVNQQRRKLTGPPQTGASAASTSSTSTSATPTMTSSSTSTPSTSTVASRPTPSSSTSTSSSNITAATRPFHESYQQLQQLINNTPIDQYSSLSSHITSFLDLLTRTPLDGDVIAIMLILAKKYGAVMRIPAVVAWLFKVITGDKSQKRSTALIILACQLLDLSFRPITSWPVEFVAAYIQDSLDTRIWCDHQDTRLFVENIVTGLKDYATDEKRVTTTTSTTDEDEEMESSRDEIIPSPTTTTSDTEPAVRPRYNSQPILDQIRVYVEATLGYTIHNLTPTSPLHALIRTLESCVGYSSVRFLISQHIESWMSNTQTTRVARSLLMSCVSACHGTGQMVRTIANPHGPSIPLTSGNTNVTTSTTGNMDASTVSHLLSLRVRSSWEDSYMEAMFKLVSHHISYWRQALDVYLNSEMIQPSQGSTTSHLRLLDVVLRATPTSASLPTQLALHLMTHLHRQDQLGKQLNIIRRISHLTDVISRWDHVLFCHTLFSPWESLVTTYKSHQFTFARTDLSHDARHISVTQLIQLAVMSCMMTTISVLSLQTKPTTSRVTYDHTERSEQAAYTWRMQLMSIQRDAICWCHTHMLRYLSTSDEHMIMNKIHEILLLQPSVQTLVQHMTRICGDWSWDMGMLRRQATFLMGNAPLDEETWTRLALISLTDSRVSHINALNLIETMCRRAALLATDARYASVALRVVNTQLIEAILQLSVHSPPEGMPPNNPPLAITASFWRACTILILICAHNPDTIGTIARSRVPTLHILMDMIMTETWIFPPFHDTNYDIMLNHKRDLEIQLILANENALPQNQHPHPPRTAATSLYLQMSYLMLLEPASTLRVPQPGVIDALRSMSREFQLSERLRTSYLTDILSSQSPSTYLTWLIPVFTRSPNTLSLLPLRTVCDVILHGAHASILMEHDDTSPTCDTDTEMMPNITCDDAIRPYMTILLERLRSVLPRGSTSPSTSTSTSEAVNKSEQHQSDHMDEDEVIEEISTSISVPQAAVPPFAFDQFITIFSTFASSLLSDDHHTRHVTRCAFHLWLCSSQHLPSFDRLAAIPTHCSTISTSLTCWHHTCHHIPMSSQDRTHFMQILISTFQHTINIETSTHAIISDMTSLMTTPSSELATHVATAINTRPMTWSHVISHPVGYTLIWTCLALSWRGQKLEDVILSRPIFDALLFLISSPIPSSPSSSPSSSSSSSPSPDITNIISDALTLIQHAIKIHPITSSQAKSLIHHQDSNLVTLAIQRLDLDDTLHVLSQVGLPIITFKALLSHADTLIPSTSTSTSTSASHSFSPSHVTRLIQRIQSYQEQTKDKSGQALLTWLTSTSTSIPIVKQEVVKQEEKAKPSTSPSTTAIILPDIQFAPLESTTPLDLMFIIHTMVTSYPDIFLSSSHMTSQQRRTTYEAIRAGAIPPSTCIHLTSHTHHIMRLLLITSTSSHEIHIMSSFLTQLIYRTMDVITFHTETSPHEIITFLSNAIDVLCHTCVSCTCDTCMARDSISIPNPSIDAVLMSELTTLYIDALTPRYLFLLYSTASTPHTSPLSHTQRSYLLFYLLHHASHTTHIHMINYLLEQSHMDHDISLMLDTVDALLHHPHISRQSDVTPHDRRMKKLLRVLDDDITSPHIIPFTSSSIIVLINYILEEMDVKMKQETTSTSTSTFPSPSPSHQRFLQRESMLHTILHDIPHLQSHVASYLATFTDTTSRSEWARVLAYRCYLAFPHTFQAISPPSTSMISSLASSSSSITSYDAIIHHLILSLVDHNDTHTLISLYILTRQHIDVVMSYIPQLTTLLLPIRYASIQHVIQKQHMLINVCSFKTCMVDVIVERAKRKKEDDRDVDASLLNSLSSLTPIIDIFIHLFHHHRHITSQPHPLSHAMDAFISTLMTIPRPERVALLQSHTNHIQHLISTYPSFEQLLNDSSITPTQEYGTCHCASLHLDLMRILIDCDVVVYTDDDVNVQQIVSSIDPQTLIRINDNYTSQLSDVMNQFISLNDYRHYFHPILLRLLISSQQVICHYEQQSMLTDRMFAIHMNIQEMIFKEISSCIHHVRGMTHQQFQLIISFIQHTFEHTQTGQDTRCAAAMDSDSSEELRADVKLPSGLSSSFLTFTASMIPFISDENIRRRIAIHMLAYGAKVKDSWTPILHQSGWAIVPGAITTAQQAAATATAVAAPPAT